jgi:hypothetical protein
MRRGLISWSKDELPEAVLDARVAALQASMAGAGLDAVVVYTTPARAAAVAWLAGFVPYWNQGLLVVPREGRPILVSALSNRVNSWMRRNAHVADVTNAARIGAEAARFAAALVERASIGVVDLPHLPAGVIEDISAAGHRVSDATALLREARAVADEADIALHVRAGKIARAALAAIDVNDPNAARLVARVDGEARRLGAEEVYPALAADLGRTHRMVRLEGAAELAPTFAVRLSVAYKGAWIRLTRTFSRDPEIAGRISRAERELDEALARLPDTTALAGGAGWWLVEGTRTALPLEPLAGSMVEQAEPLVPGAIVTVQVRLRVEDSEVLAGAPTLIGAPDRFNQAG